MPSACAVIGWNMIALYCTSAASLLAFRKWPFSSPNQTAGNFCQPWPPLCSHSGGLNPGGSAEGLALTALNARRVHDRASHTMIGIVASISRSIVKTAAGAWAPDDPDPIPATPRAHVFTFLISKPAAVDRIACIGPR